MVKAKQGKVAWFLSKECTVRFVDLYNFKRCIGFNGINLAATKADLLDRGLIIQLSKISKDKRRENEEIWAEFEIIRPKLLGDIRDVISIGKLVRRNDGPEEVEKILSTITKYGRIIAHPELVQKLREVVELIIQL